MSADGVGIQLVNTSTGEARSLIVQAGAFGEHSFTEVLFEEETVNYDGVNPGQRGRADRTSTATATRVNGKYFAVRMPPMTSVRLDCGLRRFSNDPSYAFPWHAGGVPIE